MNLAKNEIFAKNYGQQSVCQYESKKKILEQTCFQNGRWDWNDMPASRRPTGCPPKRWKNSWSSAPQEATRKVKQAFRHRKDGGEEEGLNKCWNSNDNPILKYFNFVMMLTHPIIRVHSWWIYRMTPLIEYSWVHHSHTYSNELRRLEDPSLCLQRHRLIYFLSGTLSMSFLPVSPWIFYSNAFRGIGRLDPQPSNPKNICKVLYIKPLCQRRQTLFAWNWIEDELASQFSLPNLGFRSCSTR